MPNDPSSEITIPASQMVVVPLGVFLRMAESYMRERGQISSASSKPPVSQLDPEFAQRAQEYAKRLNKQVTFGVHLEPPSLPEDYFDPQTGRADEVQA